MLGRDGDLATIAAEADTARHDGGRIVEVIGAAGIGKSTLLHAVLERLRGDGFVLWHHTATQPERPLSWTGLAAILAGPVQGFEALPRGLQAHLQSILAPDPATAVQPHGVAVAVRELIATAAKDSPLAVVVDDEHWLDGATAGVMTFAARALSAVPVVMVLSRRVDERSALDLTNVPSDRYRRVELAGLDGAAVAALVRSVVGRPLTREIVRAVAEASAGNPMLTQEMARQLAAGEPLERALAPRSIVASMRPRLERLPAGCLRAMQYAALAAGARVDVVERALGTADTVGAIADAEAAGLVEIVGGGAQAVIRFGHPTVGSAALSLMSSADRRTANLRLADVVGDPERRGVHLAAAATGVDAATARELESAGDLAARRGAPAAAAALLRASVSATASSDDDDRRRRLLALADVQSTAGLHDELLSTLGDLAPRGADEVAHLATLRIPAIAELEGLDAAGTAARAAVEQASDPDTRRSLAAQLVTIERLTNLDRGLELAERLAADADLHDDPHSADTMWMMLAACRAVVGRPVDVDAAVAMAERWPEEMYLSHAMDELLRLLWFVGDARGIDWCERSISAATATGDAVHELNSLVMLSALLPPRGLFERTEQVVLAAMQHGHSDASERADLAYVLATTGRVVEARRALAEIGSSERERGRTNVFQVQARRGMTALALGDDDAVDHLELADALAAEIGLRAPRAAPYRRDLVEALVAVGRVDDATAAAERLDGDAERCRLDNARADADAALGVVAAARGDDVTASRLFDDAAKVHERDGDHYELARTLLASGRAARRAKRRTDARRSLEEAAALFTAMGAAPWVERCSAEVERLGGRPRRTRQLTPTERQIAERARDRQSNADIAAAMFVSLRTVESNLTRVYRKLGIRSRADLADALTALDDD